MEFIQLMNSKRPHRILQLTLLLFHSEYTAIFRERLSAWAKSTPVKWSIILTGKRKEIERKKKDICLILHDAVTLLTTLLVSEIKKTTMAAQRYHDSRFQMSCKAFFSGKSP